METFGNYQIEGDLEVGGRIQVYRVQRTDGSLGNRPLCLKVWRPDPFSGADELGPLFIEASAVQQQVAQKHPRSWVSVLDRGEMDGAHFVVTPLFKDTLGKRTGSVEADGFLLRGAMLKIIAALRDLEAEAGRDHGNLKPSNIMMEGSGLLSKRRFLLTELAPSPLIGRTVFAKPDFRALGELIYMLAARTNAVSQNLRAVSAHTRWPRLGEEEEAWKQLCSELLDPNGAAQKEDLASLARRIGKLGKVKRSTGRLPQFLTLLVLFGAVGGGGYWWWSHRPVPINKSISEQYVGYRVAYEDWLGDFVRLLRRRRSEIENDPFLMRKVAPFVQERGKLIVPREAFGMVLPGDPTVEPLELAEDANLQKRVRQAYRFLFDLENLLEEWPVKIRAGELIADFRQRQWIGVADELEDAAGSYRMDETLFDQMISMGASVNSAESILANANRLLDLERTFNSLQDPLLDQVASYHQSRLSIEATSIENLRTTFSQLTTELQPVTQITATKDWQSRYAYDLFQNELKGDAVRLSGAEDLVSWSQRLQAFRRITDPRKTDLPALRTLSDRIEQNRQRLPRLNLRAEFDAYGGELTALASRMQTLESLPAIERNASILQSQLRNLQEAYNDLQNRLGELISRNLIEPGEWLARWRTEPITITGPLADLWSKRRDAIIGRESVASLRATEGRAYQLEQQLTALRSFLVELDQVLPAASLKASGSESVLNAGLESFLADERARGLRALAGLVPETASIGDTSVSQFQTLPEVAQIVSGLSEALTSASNFSVRFAQEAVRLNESPPPPEAFYGFIEEQVMAKSGWIERIGLSPARLPSLASMLQAMQLRATSEVGILLSAVNDPAVPSALRWTAWNQLFRLPAFPDSASMWNRYATAYTEFAAFLPETVRPSLDGPARWAAGVAKAKSEGLFRAGIETRGRFGGRIEDLDPAQQFAFFVLGERDLIDSDRTVFLAAGEQAASWRTRILESLRAEGWASVPAVAQLQEAVSALDPFAEVEAVDLAGIGPGSRSGWSLVSGDNSTDEVVYRYSYFDVTFRAIDTGDSDLRYLSTIEVPVGLVVEWFREKGGFNRLPDSRQDDPLLRKGPSTWVPENDGSPGFASNWRIDLELSPQWMSRSFATRSTQSRPIDEHPIQYISPALARGIAASLGCELPTPDLFKAALALSPGDSAPVWNRRDVTWGAYHDEVSKLDAQIASTSTPWPDGDIFLALSVPTGADARPAVSNNDGELWFYTFDRGSAGTPFRHLIGNVAEFLYDPETSHYFIAGASALSPAEMAPDQIFPVNPAEAVNGYSDVGLRLAFTVPRNTPGAQLARLLRNPTLLEDVF